MDKQLVVRLSIVMGLLSAGGVGIWYAQRAGSEASVIEPVEASLHIPEAPDAATPAAEPAIAPAGHVAELQETAEPRFGLPKTPAKAFDDEEPGRFDDARQAKPINSLRAQEPQADEQELDAAEEAATETQSESEEAPARNPFLRHGQGDGSFNAPTAAEEVSAADTESDSADEAEESAPSEHAGSEPPPWARPLTAPVGEATNSTRMGVSVQEAEPTEAAPEDVTADSHTAPEAGFRSQAGQPPAAMQPLGRAGMQPQGRAAMDASSRFGAQPENQAATQPGLQRGMATNEPAQNKFQLPRSSFGQQEPASLPTDPAGTANVRQMPSYGETGQLPMQQGSAATTEGTGRPGAKHLEGKQAPQVTVERIAPPEVQVGKPVTFETKIRNVGSVAAEGLEVHDEVPAGTELLKTTPHSTVDASGKLIFALGHLAAGGETTVQMEVMPVQEGEIGSVASVVFRTDASMRTVVTRPQLTLEVEGPQQVMIGEIATFRIVISNPGTGVATGVVIDERVPRGLSHAAGNELEFEVGTLKPGETRKLELTLTASEAGAVQNVLFARGEGNLEAQDQAELEVIAPALEVAISGPTKRYLERQATYTVSVSNPGTAPAKDIQLTTHLPKGLKFVKANNAGSYDPARHVVTWSLEELPPAETGSVLLTALPVEAGEQKLRTEGKAQRGLADQQEQTVVVEGLAALYFEVADVEDPVEAGGETSYEIRVVNQGSKACTQVEVAVALPPEMAIVDAEGPSRHQVQGQQVVFEPIARLAPKADTTFRLRVKGLQVGDHRVAVQVACAEIPEPVTKEESTRVYSDE